MNSDQFITQSLLANTLQEIRMLFPGIKTSQAGLTCSRSGHRKHYFFEFESFTWEGTAHDAADARAKAWGAYMRASRAKRTFLICPVRGKDPATHAAIVADLELEGYTVHFPPRDTDQDDDTGLRICRNNAAAIAAAHVVHVIWDGKSQGCLFDLGVAFALDKTIIPIELPEATEGKSFQNMIRAWSRTSGGDA